METIIKKNTIIKPRRKRITSFKAQLKQDYKATWEAYKDAKKDGNFELMRRFSSDLVKIADRLEMCDD